MVIKQNPNFDVFNQFNEDGGGDMPLNFANEGDSVRIVRISGADESRRHLQNLGFVEETELKIITKSGGNIIVSVKDGRVALSKEMASKIIVAPV